LIDFLADYNHTNFTFKPLTKKIIRLDLDVLDDKQYQAEAEKTMQEFTNLVRNTAVSSLSF